MRIRSKGIALIVITAVVVALGGASAEAAKTPKGAVVQFKSGGYGVGEGTSTAQIAIERKPSGSSTVHFGAVGGTATAGASCAGSVDYVAVADVLVIFSSQSLLTVPIALCNDNLDEPNETVIVQLSGPSSGTSLGAKRQATVTITDNDPAPSLTLVDSSTPEDDTGTMSVTLSAPSSLPISFQWSTSDGTATVGDLDYESQGGSVAIPPGQMGTSFTVQPEPDGDVESDEHFFVHLSNLINASVADGTATLTLVNDDADTTAPTSLSATIADNDSDHTFSVGDVFTIVFDEPMNTADPADFSGYVFYNDTEQLRDGEGDYVWLDSTTLEVTILSLSACPGLSCELGGVLDGVAVDFIEDAAGNDWALAGDATLEDPSPV